MVDYKETFAAIGNEILGAWRQQSYDELALPTIACDVLTNGCLDSIGPEQLIDELLSRSTFDPMQTMTPFSDMALTVFQHPRFFIEVLYWVNGTTTVHEHPFSGAFYVWRGQSLNVEYVFQLRRRLNSRCRLGDLKILSVERLREGAVKPIYDGSALIHAVFHLERPSVTVVARTYQNPDALPQLEYRYPHVAVEPAQVEPALVKRIQAINIASSCFSGYNGESISSFLERASIDDVYRIYRSLDLNSIPDAERKAIEHRICEREYGREILASIEREKVVRHVVGLRRRVTDKDLRMCLALLANIPEKSELLNFVRKEYQTEKPEDLLAEWILALSNAGVINREISDLGMRDIADAIVSRNKHEADETALSNEVALEALLR